MGFAYEYTVRIFLGAFQIVVLEIPHCVRNASYFVQSTSDAYTYGQKEGGSGGKAAAPSLLLFVTNTRLFERSEKSFATI